MSELAKNQLWEAEIEGYTAEGLGVARVEGMVVFVPGAARGDRCRLRLTKVLKHHAFARIEELLTPSSHRIAPGCPKAGLCGGCVFQHITYEEELEAKRIRVRDALTRLGGCSLDVPPVVPSPQTAQYRNKAQFPVDRCGDKVVWGFYRGRSHDLVPLEDCPIQNAQANVLARAVCQWAGESDVAVYDEKIGKGFLRHIYVRTGQGGALLCLVTTGRKAPEVGRLLELCREACPKLRGVVLNFNRDQTNRVLGEHCMTLWGQSSLQDGLCGMEFDLSPLSFYQVNHDQTEALYAEVLRLAALDQSQSALDLYCGIGTITLALAKQARQVVGVEVEPAAIRDAQENAARNQVENARFLCADAGQAAAQLVTEGFAPDVVVCDPPRKGMDAAAIEAVAALNPKRVVYVSCDCASLARDCKLLSEKGYQISSVQPFDMFPRTAHVETVALLTLR